MPGVDALAGRLQDVLCASLYQSMKLKIVCQWLMAEARMKEGST